MESNIPKTEKVEGGFVIAYNQAAIVFQVFE